jgi:hypothetical protein
MSLTDINKWIFGETDIFLAPQVVLGRKDGACNLRQGSRTVSSSIWRSATWALRLISLAFAMILFIPGCVAAQQIPPSISVDGASGGTTVTAGASMSVAVADGPGNATDWIGVCNAGVPTSSTQCDGAGYSWDYLNCTQTAPTTGVTSATCSLSAPKVAANYYAVFFSNNSYNALASAPFQVTVPSPSSPSITVNGASGGTTVSARASMSVAVANGPGNRADWIGVCNSGATPAFEQCDGAGYGWDYLNCTQTYPNTGSTSASCSLAAPGAGGNYIVGFFSNDTYTVLASAPFTVSGGGGGGNAAVVQSTKVDQINSSAGGSGLQQCVWTISQAVSAGHTVIGYTHNADRTDAIPEYPQSVTDNAGNTYNLSTGVRWDPWQEMIGMWYLTNVQGNPTQFTFTFPSGSPAGNICNAGFTEYSGANSVQTFGPTQVSGSTSSVPFTISPAARSLIWAFSADFVNGPPPPGWNPLQTPGYTLLIDNQVNDSIGVWGSNSVVPAGSLTLTYTSGYTGTCTAAGGTFNGCPLMMMAAAVR